MFYTPDILCLRKKGKLARVWLAATLSERLFRQSISNEKLLSIDIGCTCDEILKVLVSGGRDKTSRYSLYLSAQLMYGTVKLFSYQTIIFQSSLTRIRQALEPSDADFKRKRKRNKSEMDLMCIDLPEISPVREIFKDLQLGPDIHLLPEADYETIKITHARLHVESPTFGELTGDEVDFFLAEDISHPHPMFEATRIDLDQPIRYGNNDSNQRTVSPSRLIDQPDIGRLGDFQQIVDNSSVAEELREQTIKTPKKRESTLINADTPSKRRRRNLGLELEAVAPQGNLIHRSIDLQADIPQDIPVVQPIDLPTNIPQDIPDARSIDLPANISANGAIDNAIQPVNHPVNNVTVPENDDLLLDSLELEIRKKPSNKPHGRKIYDSITTLRKTTMDQQINNVLAHTVPFESRRAVPERRRFAPVMSLLRNPSTRFQTCSDNSHHSYVGWAHNLLPAFRHNTIGPFIAEIDNTLGNEALRAADSRVQPPSEEISSGLARGFEASSRNKTADDPSAHEAPIEQPAVPHEITEENDRAPAIDVAFGDITNAPILENTDDASTLNISKLPETSNQTGTGEVPRKTSSSMMDWNDLDSFLPPNMRGRDIVKKTSHEKSTSKEAIVEIPDSPSSFRSETSPQNVWTKSDLVGSLESHWSSGEPVSFDQLAPQETSSRLDAAVCLTLLLELGQEKKVKLFQEKPYGKILITKFAKILPNDTV